jgi:hypothetical protein
MEQEQDLVRCIVYAYEYIVLEMGFSGKKIGRAVFLKWQNREAQLNLYEF